MVSESNALFVTARYRSLGETYTLARFAGGLRAAGWRVDFLAFEFAAAFLREQQMPVTLLGDDRRENRVVFDRLVAERPPQVVFTTDYFLLCFKETADVWSNRWLFDLGCPVASFDHLI